MKRPLPCSARSPVFTGHPLLPASLRSVLICHNLTLPNVCAAGRESLPAATSRREGRSRLGLRVPEYTSNRHWCTPFLAKFSFSFRLTHVNLFNIIISIKINTVYSKYIMILFTTFITFIYILIKTIYNMDIKRRKIEYDR